MTSLPPPSTDRDNQTAAELERLLQSREQAQTAENKLPLVSEVPQLIADQK